MLKGKFTLSLPLRSQPTTTMSCAWRSLSETGLSWSPSGWSTTWQSATTSFTSGPPCTRPWCGGKLSPTASEPCIPWGRRGRGTAFRAARNFTSKIVARIGGMSFQLAGALTCHFPEITRSKMLHNMHCMSLLMAHRMQCLKISCDNFFLSALCGTGVGFSLTHTTTNFHLGIWSFGYFVTSEMLNARVALQGSQSLCQN